MELSASGAIDIIAREAIILEPYLDSVGVWTIGAGRTAYDGKDPRSFGKITIEKAIELFKEDVQPYANAVKATGKPFNQFQFDALTSACYNFGQGNLRKLCSGRSVDAIGQSLMLYTKPPEITGRRRGEQRLYREGIYSCADGRVLVAPVRNNRPYYKGGYYIDARPYFGVMAKPTAPANENGIVIQHTTLELQKALNRLGTYPPLSEDGIMGPKTREEIRDYQKSRGLKDDSIPGPKTWGKIESELQLLDMKKAA
jgi:lysozyme